ncbi:MAG: hypothetical protein V7642_5320 [Burkholderiales bacterium]
MPWSDPELRREAGNYGLSLERRDFCSESHGGHRLALHWIMNRCNYPLINLNTRARGSKVVRLPLRHVNSAKMAFSNIEKAMKRDRMLMEAILGHLLKSPEPLIGTSAIAQALNIELPIIRHHLHLLQDKGLVQVAETTFWRLTNQGHDYMEGAPEQGVSLASLG